MRLPEFREARIVDSDLSQARPVEAHADLVVELRRGPGRARAGVVLEVQRDVDPDKRYRWASQPIDMGHPGYALRPIVLGPGHVPRVTDPEAAAAHPELAVLSAMTHGPARNEAGLEVARAALAGILRLDPNLGDPYITFILHALGEAARRKLEMEIKTGNWTEPTDLEKRIMERGRAQATTDAKAQAIIAVLTARGIEVPPDVRERILGCRDVPTLDAWIVRAATAERAEDVVG